MSISQNIVQLKASLPANVTLVAVSKFHPAAALEEAYNAGQRVFGESRAQELTAKQKVLPGDIEWHFIGPLQSNKVKDIAPFIHTIHSIDSLKLLQEVNKQALKKQPYYSCLAGNTRCTGRNKTRTVTRRMPRTFAKRTTRRTKEYSDMRIDGNGDLYR